MVTNLFHACLAIFGPLVKPFTRVNDQCALCTAEKKVIIFKPDLATLNTRNELGAHCKHKESRLLYKKPKEKDKT